jgi:hypothetical protein
MADGTDQGVRLPSQGKTVRIRACAYQVRESPFQLAAERRHGSTGHGYGLSRCFSR